MKETQWTDRQTVCEPLAECVVMFQWCWEVWEVTHIGLTHVSAMHGSGYVVGIGTPPARDYGTVTGVRKCNCAHVDSDLRSAYGGSLAPRTVKRGVMMFAHVMTFLPM